jgi:hypothetical protein
LKHASRSWSIHFDEVVKSFAFIKREEEATLHKKFCFCVAFPIFYVDGIPLIANLLLQPIKESLEKSFLMLARDVLHTTN